jgi:hypothetical protein
MWVRARKVIAAISTPRPAPTAREVQAKTKAEYEAAMKARAAAWEAAQEAEWRERVKVAHEAAIAPFERGELTDGRGFSNEIPTLDLSDDDVWIDAFGRVKRPSHLGRRR